MDTLRGAFDTHGPFADEDVYDEDTDQGGELLPLNIGNDERRMQVRAYNFWASLLEDRNYPSIEDLNPSDQNDFGPSSVLLDFSKGTENPGIAYLGDMLAAECGAAGRELETLADVPPRSLLSRITDHYLQIIANQAPIGFEAEFVNQAGVTILYRGILLPFSSDDDTIDFIYGVINWKEMADARSADELLLEIDQAIEGTTNEAALSEPSFYDEDEELFDGTPSPSPLMKKKPALPPISDWADGPDADEVEQIAAFHDAEERDLPRPSLALDAADEDGEGYEMPLELSEELAEDYELPFGEEEQDEYSEYGEEEDGESDVSSAYASLTASAPSGLPAEDGDEIEHDEIEHGAFEPVNFQPVEEDEDLPVAAEVPELPTAPAAQPMALADWLAAAREQVAEAHEFEDRSRAALYEAIGRAWDFAIAASHDPDGFADLLEDAGLTMQDRAPMTPVVKLVFGVDYDKTRLTEYAAALSHAQRMTIEQGQLATYIAGADGGLKGIVAAERRARRAEAGKPEPEQRHVPRASIAKKLRKVAPVSLAEIAPEGSEFALVMIRRTPEGTVEVLGEVPQDIAMVEKAARSFV